MWAEKKLQSIFCYQTSYVDFANLLLFAKHYFKTREAIVIFLFLSKHKLRLRYLNVRKWGQYHVVTGHTNLLGLPLQNTTNGWLEQPSFIFSQLWRLEVPDQDSLRWISGADFLTFGRPPSHSVLTGKRASCILSPSLPPLTRPQS